MSDARIELAPGYTISRLIHGGWQLSAGHHPETTGGAHLRAGETVDELLRLVDAGITTFDGADIYTGVEALYGRLLDACRRRGTLPPQIHTKVVPDLALLPKLERRHVEALVDRSLRRLGTERIDLAQFHWWDTSVPGWLEAAAWLDDLRRVGKIRHLGVTNFDREQVGAILDAGIALVAQQVQYSVLDRRPEGGLVELARGRDVALLAYGTLAGGFLTRTWSGADEPDAELANRSLTKYRLVIRDGGGWRAYQHLLASLEEVASRHGVSPANVAVRWILDRPGVAAAIVGGRSAAHLASNLETLRLELDDEDRELLSRALEGFPGPTGDVYHLERDRRGAHGSIMRYDLNALADPASRTSKEDAG